jgi:hypothetical protein
MLDAGVALAVYLLARNEMLKTCIAVVAYWTIMCGEWPDALAIVLVFALAFNNCMVAGISLTFAYNTWAVFLFKVPWAHKTSELPAFKTFLASLRRVKKKGRRQSRHADNNEHQCMICWTSDYGLPLRLPCRRDHLVCRKCLVRLHGSNRNQCPFCRLPLYTIDNPLVEICGFAIAFFAASCAIGPVFVVLICYVEWYFWAAVAILLTAFITAPIMWDMWQLSTRSLEADDDYLERWLGAMLVRHGMPAVVFACWCVYRIWKLDRVTFVDGQLLGEVSFSEGYSFFAVW